MRVEGRFIMKVLWCWRCKQEMPMLDEDEYKVISELYTNCIKSVKKYREEKDVSLSATPVDDIFEPVRKKYEEITGLANIHRNAIIHHRISLYGDPCSKCGKPLRTPRAKQCAACGQKVQ